ncbi:MAG: hypothetical protein JEZ05_10590 [Tenericutes bacterium]|nr:hypothetical protein [Mycoplasmatota bacterium]
MTRVTIKIIMLLLVVFLLTACYPAYDKKHDDNPSYYTDWLEENGIVDYEEEAEPTGTNEVETVYKMYAIDKECDSRNIRLYYGIEEATNKSVTVYMPDKIGEPNIIVYNLVYDLDILKQEILTYNQNTELLEISLDENQIRMKTIDYLWGGLIIDGVEQEIDEEEIKDFVFTNLSNPMIFQIGTIREESANTKYIYLGLNIDNEYVLFSQSMDHNTLEIVYTYSATII